MKRPDFSLEYLRKTMDYDPLSGIFTWKVSRNAYGGGVKPGDAAGTPDGKGHLVIGIDGERYMAHRLAWFFYYGVWPGGEIDHRNMSGTDNRIANLRDIGPDRGLQRANQRVRIDSKSGLKGVQKKKNCRYTARISHRGDTIYLGTFSSPEEAHAAYIAKANELFGEYARAA